MLCCLERKCDEVEWKQSWNPQVSVNIKIHVYLVVLFHNLIRGSYRICGGENVRLMWRNAHAWPLFKLHVHVNMHSLHALHTSIIRKDLGGWRNPRFPPVWTPDSSCGHNVVLYCVQNTGGHTAGVPECCGHCSGCPWPGRVRQILPQRKEVRETGRGMGDQGSPQRVKASGRLTAYLCLTYCVLPLQPQALGLKNLAQARRSNRWRYISLRNAQT